MGIVNINELLAKIKSQKIKLKKGELTKEEEKNLGDLINYTQAELIKEFEIDTKETK